MNISNLKILKELVSEDNAKQNPEERYTKKYQKYVACSYGYKWVRVDDKFSKPFKYYLVHHTVYNFINVIKNSKYFKKEIVMARKDNEDFENS